MSVVYKGGTVDVTVPVGQKIAISAIEATAVIYYSTFPNSPERYYEETRLTDSSTEIGTFSSDKKIRIESLIGDIIYDIAVTPSIFSKSELDQLENIGATTISAAQWAYIGGMDQAISTTDTPSFSGLNYIGVATSNTAFANVIASNDGDSVASISFRRDGNNDAGAISFGVQATGGGLDEVSRITSKGNLLLGTTSQGTNAIGVLTLGNGTQGSSLANAVQIVSEDLTPGNTIPSIMTEGGGIYSSGTPAASTGSIAIKVDGTVYYFTVSTTAAA